MFCMAKPIWAEGLEKEKNITLGLHTKIQNPHSGALYVRIATSGVYRLFINGQFVTYGPARCAHGHYRVDNVPIDRTDEILHVAVEVHNYYINSFSNLRQPGFVQIEILDGDKVLAATGENCFSMQRLTERVQKVPRFSYQRPSCESYHLTADVYDWHCGQTCTSAYKVNTVIVNEKYFVERGMNLYHFPIISPVKVLSYGTLEAGIKPAQYRKDRYITQIGDADKGELGGFKEEELELNLNDEVQEFKTTSVHRDEKPYNDEVKLSIGQWEILTLGQEKTGFISFHVECMEPSTIYVMVDERLRANDDVDPLAMECINAFRLDLEPGRYTFQSMEVYGFQYLKLVCTAGSVIMWQLHVKELICPQPVVTQYKGTNPQLKVIFEAAKETFLQNSADFFMDCPTRERAGWLCDSYFTARAEKVFTGNNVIERAFLQNYLLAEKFERIPEGMVPMCYPSDCLRSNGEYIPNWAMWLVIELEDYVARTGDKAFVELFRKRVYDLLKWFEQYENQDGLLECLPGWIFVEWSRSNDLVQDINFPTNMVYARMLQSVFTLYGDKDAGRKAGMLVKTIRQRSFNGQFFLDNEVYQNGNLVSPGEATETCQYYAFFTGIATPELYPELWQIILNDFGPQKQKKGAWSEVAPSNMFIGIYLRLELLLQYGYCEQLLEECVEYFLNMASLTGTLWEHNTGHASCNHGFASYAAVLILEAEKRIHQD